MKVTILTVTKRTGGLDVLEDSLRRQTILPALVATHEIEWVIIDELANSMKRHHAVRLTAQRLGLTYVHVRPPDYDPPRYAKLNRAENTGLDLACGEYIFFLNDYVWIPDDTLAQMLGVSEKEDFPLLVTCPNERTSFPPPSALRTGDTSYTIFATFFRGKQWGFPNVPFSERDERRLHSREAKYHTNPIEWEAPVAMAPRKLFLDAGGYDEDLDYGYAQDNIDIANRALLHDPKARVCFLRDLVTISLDTAQYFPKDEDDAYRAALQRNMDLVTPRIPARVFGGEDTFVHTPKISIVSVTRAPGGIDIFEDNLRRQTAWKDLVANRDVEWIIVDELTHENAQERIKAWVDASDRLGLKDITITNPDDYDPPRYTKLARARNTGISAAHGDYIFFLDSYIWIPDDYIAKNLKLIADNPRTLLTTPHCDRTRVLGDAYQKETPDALSIYYIPFHTERYNFPHVETYWQDPRMMPFTFSPYDWEAMASFVPRQAILRAGGYDEGMDYGYANDNTDMANRILRHDPDARIAYLQDALCLNIDHPEMYPRDQVAHEVALERNRNIITKRIEGDGFYKNQPHDLDVTSDRLSVAFWMPDIGNWQDIDPTDPFEHALGGRETACIRLAQELTALGRDVTIITKTTRNHWQRPGLSWVRPDRMRANDISAYDVVISMDRPDIFGTVRARKLNIVQFQCSYSPMAFPDSLDRKIDHYFLLSNYQRFTLRSREGTIDADKCVVFGNGVDVSRYDNLDVRKVKNRLVWSSSPDRGLWHLIRWWPQLRARLPDITLRVFYDLEKGIGPHRWGMNLQSEWYLLCKEGMTMPGIEYMGPVDQMTLAREQKKADLFVYPCDPVMPTETFCITALENAAAGVPMLLSQADCLQEVYGGERDCAWFAPLPILDDEWIKAIGDLLNNAEDHDLTIGRARTLAEHFTWAKIAGRWSHFIDRRIALDNPDAINDLIDDEEKARGYGVTPMS